MKRNYVVNYLIVICIILSFIFVSLTQAATNNVLILYSPDYLYLLEDLSLLVQSYGYQPVTLSIDYCNSLDVNTYKLIIITTPKAFSVVTLSSKVPTLCIGSGFDAFIPDLSTLVLPKTRCHLSLDHWTSTTPIVHELPLIQSYQGIPYGEILFTPFQRYPLYIQYSDTHYYFPYINTHDVSIIGLGAVLHQLLTPTVSPQLYITVTDTFTTNTPHSLALLADSFYSYGLPFIISIDAIPNDYASANFRDFCESLKYAQSKNGTLILNAPNEDLKDAFQRSHVSFQETIEPLYPLTIDFFETTTSSTKTFGSLPFNATITLNLPKETRLLSSIVQLINTKWLSISDITPLEINTPYYYVPLVPSTVVEPTYEHFFTIGNIILFFILFIILIIFCLLIILGHYLYKRKFYTKHRGD